MSFTAFDVCCHIQGASSRLFSQCDSELQTFAFTQQPSSATGQMSHNGTSFLDSSRLCSVCEDPMLPNGNTCASKVPVCPSCAHQIMKVQAGGPDPSDFLPPSIMTRNSARQADFWHAHVTG